MHKMSSLKVFPLCDKRNPWLGQNVICLLYRRLLNMHSQKNTLSLSLWFWHLVTHSNFSWKFWKQLLSISLWVFSIRFSFPQSVTFRQRALGEKCEIYHLFSLDYLRVNTDFAGSFKRMFWTESTSWIHFQPFFWVSLEILNVARKAYLWDSY